MKKLNILMIMLITSFLFVACEKEETTSNNKTEKNKSEIMAPPGSGCDIYHLDRNDHWSEWCKESGCNCTEAVVVTPSQVDEFEDYISGGSSGVGDFFNDDDLWAEMFPNIEGTEFLEKLQSGNYTIETYVQEDGTHIWKATHVDDEEDYFGLTGAYDEE